MLRENGLPLRGVHWRFTPRQNWPRSHKALGEPVAQVHRTRRRFLRYLPANTDPNERLGAKTGDGAAAYRLDEGLTLDTRSATVAGATEKTDALLEAMAAAGCSAAEVGLVLEREAGLQVREQDGRSPSCL
ncbi:MAG: hypothetical protein Q7R39_00985 [Dehalococcoidia bacterium]|nr:hypothetical protein [Dehalococcoidia bacterium]